MYLHICLCITCQPPDGVGVRHEPNEFPEWFCDTAQTDGSWPSDPFIGGCHLGRLL